MFDSRTALFALFAAFGMGGCSQTPAPQKPGGPANLTSGPGAADVKPVPIPAELVGKWRLEVKAGDATRTSVYCFLKDGHIEIETHFNSPDRKVTDLVKAVVSNVEGDKISVIELSHTSKEGVEDVMAPEKRQLGHTSSESRVTNFTGLERRNRC